MELDPEPSLKNPDFVSAANRKHGQFYARLELMQAGLSSRGEVTATEYADVADQS